MLLFVYGSLKSGLCHHHRLRGATLERDAATAPGYGLVWYGDYPALVIGGSGKVYGELYSVDARLLAELDEFEGCPDLYHRRSISLEGGGEAQAYVIDAAVAAQCQPIASGIWLEPR